MAASLDDLKHQLEEIKSKRVGAERELAKHEARLETLMETLKNEFKLDSVEQAKEKCKSLTENITVLTGQLEQSLSDISQQLQEIDAK